MSRAVRFALVVPMVLVAIATACVAALLVLPGQARLPSSSTGWWTDGRRIHVDAHTAQPRRVLWEPAAPWRPADPAQPPIEEYEPRVVAADGIMLLVRGRPGANCDLWVAQRTHDGWSEPLPLATVNTEADELGPALSPDGTRLYFCSDRDGGLGGYDLWMASRSAAAGDVEALGGSWSTPINLGPAVNSPFNEHGPALTPDGARLYFASNRPRPDEPAASTDPWQATVRERRTRHDYDLYESVLAGAEPAVATPLAAINTPSDEASPVVSPAGDVLWFASDRPGGQGGLDLYRAWLTDRPHDGAVAGIERLEEAINSSWHDLDPTLAADGFRVVFSSDRPMADPADAPEALAAADRYALWSSVSREVWLEERHDPSLAQALADAIAPLLPWILLLLLGALLLWLLSRLLSRGDLRARLARLSLLMQCLLASLMLHAMLVALLAVWHVGTGLESLLRSSGGTRVVVEGSMSDAAELDGLADQIHGQIRSQIRGELTSMDLDVLPPAPSLEMPPVDAASTAALELAARLEHEEHAPPQERWQPATDALVSAALHHEERATVESPRLPSPEAPDALPAEPGLVTPVAHVQAVQSPIESPASPPAIDASIPATHLDPAAPAAVDAATIDPTRLAASISTPRSLPHDSTIPTAAPPSQRSAAQEPAGPSPPIAAVAPIPAPTEGTAGGPAGRPVAELGSRIAVPEVPIAAAPRRTSAVPAPPTAPAMPRRAPADAHAMSVPSLGPPPPFTTPPETATSTRPASPLPSLGPALSQASPPPAPSSTTPVELAAPARSRAASTAQSTAQSSGQSTAQSSGQSTAASTAGAATSLTPSGSSPDRASMGLAQAPSRLLDAPRLPEVPAPADAPVPRETFGQRDPESRAEVLERTGGSARTEHAVARALEWFARHQSRDGRWSAQHFDRGFDRATVDRAAADAPCGCDRPAEVHMDLGTTSLALLCFLGAGHTQAAEGPYRQAVEAGLAWIVARQRRDGDLRHGGSPEETSDTMYGQTIAAVALCEAFAMTSDGRLANAARQAVRFVIERTEASRRGRTAPEDTAVLGWQLMVFASARRAGIDVPARAWEHARLWLESVSVPGAPGRYAYGRGGRASVAMTAEAMFVRQLLDELDERTPDATRMEQSAAFVVTILPAWTEAAPTHHWYYATLALHHHQGDAWRRWNEALAPALVDRQRADGCAAGSWDPQDEWSTLGGRLYQTAICTLSLEAYYRYRTADEQRGGD